MGPHTCTYPPCRTGGDDTGCGTSPEPADIPRRHALVLEQFRHAFARKGVGIGLRADEDGERSREEEQEQGEWVVFLA